MKVITEGIILNETNYSETSKILNILTKEYGYISVISKGSRNLKSKLRGISMKLVYANFSINYKENGMSTLLEGSVINSFKYIMNDLNKMQFSLYLINLVKSVLKESNDLEIFSILKDSLIKINDGYDPLILTNIVEFKLLKYLGVQPNFDKCMCGSSNILTFDINLASVVCNNCYQDTYLFSNKTLKLLKLFWIIDIDKISKINVSLEIKEEIDNFIKEYYNIYTGIYLLNKKKIIYNK